MANLTITAASVIAGDNASRKYAAAGEAITAGQAVYLASGTKRWMLADSNSATAEARRATAIALNSAATGQPVAAAERGDVTLGAVLTAGETYWLSDVPGAICPDADVGAGEYLCMLGIAKSTSVLALAIQYPGVAR